MRDNEASSTRCLRIAAAGDLHCSEHHREEILRSVAALEGKAEVVCLCGDLTTHGEPQQAAVLAEACAQLDVPVFAVLGNHDWHANRHDELLAALTEGGIRVLERDWAVCEAGGLEVGIVGVKGFVGGFPGSHLPDFGEPLLREIYRETSRDVAALDQGLREIALCPARIVMLHYSPSEQTIAGEAPGIFAFLGTDRLAAPIAEHEPDMVLHGHAHAGQFSGAIGEVPVYNVSIPVMGRDFWLFELDAPLPTQTPIH
ncbi:MAG: metallophosphoesterase [Solirubrobacterales bacterium]|nr:metallophosphoesterase [Solirubrobacterales bacterium]